MNCVDISSGETTRPIALAPFVATMAERIMPNASAHFAVGSVEGTQLIVRVSDAAVLVESTRRVVTARAVGDTADLLSLSNLRNFVRKPLFGRGPGHYG